MSLDKIHFCHYSSHSEGSKTRAQRLGEMKTGMLGLEAWPRP